MQSRTVTHASAQLHRDLFENSTPDDRLLLHLDLATFGAHKTKKHTHTVGSLPGCGRAAAAAPWPT